MEEGNRFSQIYLTNENLVDDSRRMRNRLAAYLFNNLFDRNNVIAKKIELVTGAKVPWIGSGYSINKFMETAELRDVLDSVSIVYSILCDQSEYQGPAVLWKNFVGEVLREERVSYRIDGQCVVHLFVDEEFERSRRSAIAGLDNHPAILAKAQRAYELLDHVPLDTSGAIKSIFEAVEILYKQLVDARSGDRLNRAGVKSKLIPALKNQFSGNSTEEEALEKLLNGMEDWIDSGHMYRHGQKDKEPTTPSIDFTVLYVSQGASYLRYLVGLMG